MDISTYEPMLKKYYADGRPQLEAYKNFPTLRLLKKVTDWTGENYEVPLWDETGQAVAHDFSTAQEGKSSAGEGSFVRWSVSDANFYGFAKLNRKVMKASMGNARAFLSHYTEKVDGTLQLMGREMASKIFRTRRHLRGVVSSGSTLAAGIVVLTERTDVVMLSVGMRLTFCDASNSDALITFASDNPVIVSIDRSAGSFVVGDGPGGAAIDLTTAGSVAVAAGDKIYRKGDVLTASDTLGFAGFDEWIPSTAPGSTSFYGVDRSVDTDKRGGLRVSGTGLTMEDALIEGSQRAFESGVKLTHWICNPLRFGQLTREMGSKLERNQQASQQLGVRAFDVTTNAGDQVLYADPFCQPNVIWGITASTWKIISRGPLPEIFDEDFRMLREATSDDYEVRLGGYGQVVCHYPGGNVRIDLE